MNDTFTGAVVVKSATLLLITLLTVAACAQQATSALNGKWKLVKQVSQPAVAYAPKFDTYDIKLAGLKLLIIHRFEDPTGKVYTIHSSYVLDGKERLASGFPDEVFAKAYWDGDVLVLEKRQQVEGSVARWVMRYSVSHDGKSLTVRNQVSESKLAPAFEQEILCERQ